MQKVLLLLLTIFMLLWVSCSHKYDPDIHNLDFYQWNLWEDDKADPEENLPSCGWEDLHRGKGKLVRIPALLDEHFQELQQGGIYWYHCRFTLPEGWAENSVSLVFEGRASNIELYLNEKKIGSFQGEASPGVLDVSETIFHTRDNHLSIRLIGSEGGIQEKLKGITRIELHKKK